MRSACSATKSRSAKSFAVKGGSFSSVVGKFSPFSTFSRSPLARAAKTSISASPFAFATTRAPILPSLIQSCAPISS